MSFLNQLKTQANALQSQQNQKQASNAAHAAKVDAACRTVQTYLEDLARQLNVIGPAGPAFTLDGKTRWPAMKLQNFRVDARKKSWEGREVFDFVAMGWQVLPQAGGATGGAVTVNFPPDLERVESRLSVGHVKHERKEIRHPEKNTLQALVFEYQAETRGNVTVTAVHDSGELAFRLANVNGFGVISARYKADDVHSGLLDELAKLIVSQPSRFG